ncbi:MAG: KilA-N domain-containing protein, partial [Anaerovoracaceae bacterium]
ILPADPTMKLPTPLAYSALIPNPMPTLKDIDILAISEKPMREYISLTKFVQSRHMENPSYVIQSWMRSEHTLAFLDLWEQENNPAYDTNAYTMLLEKKKFTSFTVTAKQWIGQTKAIGITSKQGKQGGTFAHPIIACQFATWLSPEYMMRMLKMAELEDDFFKEEM